MARADDQAPALRGVVTRLEAPVGEGEVGPLGWARPSHIPFRQELGESILSPVNRTTPRRPPGHAAYHESDAPF